MHSPLEQFEIKPLIPLEMSGYDVSFTNSSLFMIITLFIVFAFLGLSVKKISDYPGRLQASGEMLYNFICDMIDETAGEKAKPYVPFMLTLFMFIITCNLLGMFPFTFTVTSHIAVTFAMAITIFLAITLLGFFKHGFHFLTLFVPKGAPMFLAPLMIVIEFIAYLVRPVSLSIRLAANMTAGHIVMKVIASLILMFGIVVGLLPFALLTILVGFEIFVAVLQAYIFTILTCVYLSDALNLH